jgi:hypothetical protein
MGRRRKAGNTGYPQGVYPSRGWLFWRDQTDGHWERICKLDEWGTKPARDRWTELSTGNSPEGTVAAMLDWEIAHREQLVREGKLDKRTLADNTEYLKPLKAVFATMRPQDVNGRHVAGYLEKRSFKPRPRRGAAGELVEQAPRRAPIRANKEIALLSSTYSRAMTSPDWQQVTSNPCHGVRRNPTKASERCPEIWEIEAAKLKAHGAWPLIFDLAYKGGQRGVQMRLLPKTAIHVDGIRPPVAKGGLPVFIEWDDELIAVVLGLLEYTAEVERKLHVVSPYVIVARSGAPYTPHGWKTTMYKIVRAALADPANALKEPFSFHNFRARSATDEEEIYGRSSQGRLGHRKRATTDDYIRGKGEKRVKPLPLRKAS